MKGVLLRVGCDTTEAGGGCNAPVNAETWDYTYVPIPESRESFAFPAPSYAKLPCARKPGLPLPTQLDPTRPVHLDPDFASLTVGEPGDEKGLSSRGRILNSLEEGDLIAFFAGFRPTIKSSYAYGTANCLFGIFRVQQKTRVKDLTDAQRQQCAHGHRLNAEHDLVIWANPKDSGRFPRAIPIGEWRSNSYRIRQDLLDAWGGVSTANGYIQRSAQPPLFTDPKKFLKWLTTQIAAQSLLQEN